MWVASAYITIIVLVAALAYVFAPDDSPNANKMVLELSARKPGFSCDMLLIPTAASPVRRSLLQGLLFGQPVSYKEMPIVHYSFSDTIVRVAHFIDDGLQDTLAFPLRAFLPNNMQEGGIQAQREYVSAHCIERRVYLLGADRYGRDILSRLLVGARVSVAVGLISVLLSLTIGTVLGLLAGYYGGMTDRVIMWFINVLWAIPSLLLVFAVTITLGKGFWEIFLAIGLTMWVGSARLVRGQVLSIRELDYVTAARALAFSDLRIMFRHILPNIAGTLLVVGVGNFSAAILTEAGLSFLGIGVQPPMPSWGLMVKEHYNFLLTNRPLLAVIPGLAIMMLVYSFNVLGNALRDELDVRQ